MDHVTLLLVPETESMVRLPIDSARLAVAGDASPQTVREDLRALGSLLHAMGQDAAWALLDPDDEEIASWIAVSIEHLDGRTPGQVRLGHREDAAWDRLEAVRETEIGPALKISERVPVPLPTADDEDARIVSVNITWSWVLDDAKLLVLRSNTTSLDHAAWVEAQVDLIAEGVRHSE